MAGVPVGRTKHELEVQYPCIKLHLLVHQQRTLVGVCLPTDALAGHLVRHRSVFPLLANLQAFWLLISDPAHALIWLAKQEEIKLLYHPENEEEEDLPFPQKLPEKILLPSYPGSAPPGGPAHEEPERSRLPEGAEAGAGSSPRPPPGPPVVVVPIKGHAITFVW